MKSERGRMTIGTGASSILMIFVVLCLTVLGVLSLVSARADGALTDRTAEAALAYYTADASAQAKLADIDGSLYRARQTAKTRENPAAAYPSLYPSELPEGVSAADGMVSFAVPLSDGRSLSVELAVLPYEAPQRYRIAAYRVLSQEEEADQGLSLWQGDTLPGGEGNNA